MTMATSSPSKRQRETQPGKEDFHLKANIIMQADPFKERAPRERDRAFRALFGCSDSVAHILWTKLNKLALLPRGGTMTHLLWTLMFLKVYPSEVNMKVLTGGADNKTIRKWVNAFVGSISILCSLLVS